jgi:hypothetical protein
MVMMHWGRDVSYQMHWHESPQVSGSPRSPAFFGIRQSQLAN